MIGQDFNLDQFFQLTVVQLEIECKKLLEELDLVARQIDNHPQAEHTAQRMAYKLRLVRLIKIYSYRIKQQGGRQPINLIS